MGMRPRITRDNQTSDVDFLALEVLWQAEIVFDRLVWNSIVTDKRVGQNKNLAAITWIGQRFRISDHSCVEDDLTGDGDGSSERTGLNWVGSICQVKVGWFALYRNSTVINRFKLEREQVSETDARDGTLKSSCIVESTMMKCSKK